MENYGYKGASHPKEKFYQRSHSGFPGDVGESISRVVEGSYNSSMGAAVKPHQNRDRSIHNGNQGFGRNVT